MKQFSKIISYLFHPLLVPIAGTITYYILTPKYNTLATLSANIIPIFILTVVIPIIAFFILKNIGLINSIFIPNIKDRRYPLIINITLLAMVVLKIIPRYYSAELYYFFLGLIAASLAILVLSFLNFKGSLHLMGAGSFCMFLINLSVHFEINITLILSFFILATGVIASARLYLKAHNKAELIIGFFIGLISQLLTIKFWI